MALLDRRFALVRNDGSEWFAALIKDRTTGQTTYRISGDGSRDALKQSEQLVDIEKVVKRVVLEGRRMRCAPESGPASSLYLNREKGYRVDPSIAAKLGIASSTA